MDAINQGEEKKTMKEEDELVEEVEKRVERKLEKQLEEDLEKDLEKVERRLERDMERGLVRRIEKGTGEAEERAEAARGAKRALVTFLFALGFIIMVISLITDWYEFVPHGLIGWLAAWSLAIILLAWFGSIAPKEERPED
jgi:Flp pilus assembly protein TadB